MSCGNLESFIQMSQAGAELWSIVGQQGGWTTSERDEVVHQNVRYALDCEFHGGGVIHVYMTPEWAREKESVGISSRRERQGLKVNADGDIMVVGEYEPRQAERRGGDRRRSKCFERVKGDDKASYTVMHYRRPCDSNAGQIRLVDSVGGVECYVRDT